MSEDTRLPQAVRRKNALQDLLRSEGWAALKEVLQEQLERRRNEVELKPLSSLDAALAQEYMKGEIHQLRLLVVLPDSLIDEDKSVIDAFANKEEEENA